MNTILHFGVGAFHRSHQAYAWHKLRELDPEQYGNWSITGVCLMPGDRALVDTLRTQQNQYSLRMRSPAGIESFEKISSISQILYGPDNPGAVIDAIARPDTRLLSFTITEGGYQVDFSDLSADDQPRTVFGYLAKGLELRKSAGSGGLVMMSCDNIQENGRVLKDSLLGFLEQYDENLKNWAEQHLIFPSSMVDRITPVTSEADKDDFEKHYGFRDEALVVSENYFQWVLEDSATGLLPPLERVGVEVVSDVRPYESMKLGILNAGHSLVGFLGDALGYHSIHESVVDQRISRLFDHYATEEAIPVLEPIEGLNLTDYFQQVKARFSNAMINDSNRRIISGSSDKIPKFIVPIIHAQLRSEKPGIAVCALVIASWWYYLERSKAAGQMDQIQDNVRKPLMELFSESHDSARAFIAYQPIFGDLASERNFMEPYLRAVDLLRNHPVEKVLDEILIKLDNE